MNTASLAKQDRISYWFILVTLVFVGWLHMATPLLAVLFSYLLLSKLRFTKNRWFAIALFTVILLGLLYGLASFVNLAIRALPDIANKSIPAIIDWAKERDVELPFTDYQSLKAAALDIVTDQVKYLGNFANLARGATTEVAFLLIGCVVAVSIFINGQFDLDRGTRASNNNLYAASCEAIAQRFRRFYQSFNTVIGAQIIISAINTVVTSIFVLSVQLPYSVFVLGVTFLCGLLPVIGNLISNTVVVGISFSISPRLALAALIFLVLIHKLEYFLNSKIIGDRIRNPVWLTLLALIVGEKLMGIPGMILAPVVLHYIKVEASSIEMPAGSTNPGPSAGTAGATSYTSSITTSASVELPPVPTTTPVTPAPTTPSSPASPPDLS